MHSLLYEDDITVVEREHKRVKRRHTKEPKLNCPKEFRITDQAPHKKQTPQLIANLPRSVDFDTYVLDPQNKDIAYVFDKWKIQLLKVENDQITVLANFLECNKRRIYGLDILEDGTLIASQQQLVVTFNLITRQFNEILSLEHFDCSLGKLAVDKKCNSVFIVDLQNDTIFKWNRTSNKVTMIETFHKCIDISIDSKSGDLYGICAEKLRPCGVTMRRNHWLDWDLARLLWIGKFKNTKECPFTWLPSEIVLEIVKFASYY